LLADKLSTASVDGLNQNFLLVKDGNRSRCKVKEGLSLESLGTQLLKHIAVEKEVAFAQNEYSGGGKSFSDLIELFSNAYSADKKILSGVGSQCKSCEFRIGSDLKDDGFKSGFEECWLEQAKIKPEDFKRHFVFDIWNFRKSDELISENIYFMDQVEKAQLSPKSASSNSDGLSMSERQWLQVSKTQASDQTPFVDTEGLANAFSQFRYPLNFIDFETTMVAIPFNKGRRPYEQIAFQFSHHVVTKDGAIEHRTEYINRKRGHFPNFDFVRELKKALEKNSGTIFRYATHENTVLCQIHHQLEESNEIDKDELCKWIETITKYEDKDREWEGSRNMVDLCELVKKYYYNPSTKGSNSIKKVLPAILASSKLIQEKYSKPIYGSEVSSKNYKDWTWIKLDDSGKVIDPYKLLPAIFSDFDLEEMDAMVSENTLADGGAAMTAYARMQFTEMSELEADRVAKALLKYCELDTFAMVLIYEYWEDLLGLRKDRRAA